MKYIYGKWTNFLIPRLLKYQEKYVVVFVEYYLMPYTVTSQMLFTWPFCICYGHSVDANGQCIDTKKLSKGFQIVIKL